MKPSNVNSPKATSNPPLVTTSTPSAFTIPFTVTADNTTSDHVTAANNTSVITNGNGQQNQRPSYRNSAESKENQGKPTTKDFK